MHPTPLVNLDVPVGAQRLVPGHVLVPLVERSVTDDELGAPFFLVQVQLDRQFQVSGWMLFDVPKGLTLGTFWWDEVDEVVLDYVEYRRRN